MINTVMLSNLEVMKSIIDARDLSDSTLGYYERTLLKLCKDTQSDTIEHMLEQPKMLLEHLEAKNRPYQMNLVCILIVATASHFPDHDESLTMLRTRQSKLKGQIVETIKKNDKSPKEKENWCSYKDLRKCLKKRENHTKKILKRGNITIEDIFEIQKWIICGLYIGDKENPPLRLDYINMILNFDDAFIDVSHNAINNIYCQSQRTKTIYLQEYKTARKYGPKQIKLRPYLNRMINVWLRVREKVLIDGKPVGGNSLLFSRSLRPFTESTCCVYLAEAFKPTGKHITVNLIRHIFISDVVRDMCYEDKKRISGNMCHNIDMQTQYIKND